ncbi:MAG: 16S rRNA (cytosine(1402)-N(4))-methyltransferase RsmH [Alphaproteobacteria bacterium]|jgi:16S rRNA (cytosine1402-N4)-methyltransferase|nr:16S rRNA (cytosine(1402)-N(4))-methyltransferase RsmH [Alphaproteobacteria bacterium]
MTMPLPAARHEPVMRDEVLAALAPADGEQYVDGTFGAGGYALAILGAADCLVYGIDRDPDVLGAAEPLRRANAGRLELIAGRFAEMDRLLAERKVAAVDGVALDLGVSSMQIDDPARGFSFQKDGPLDMRMEQVGTDAAEFVNHASETELADVIHVYGEERRARAVARAIVKARREGPIRRTGELAEIVARAVGRSGRLHPATRTFQALRIHVNDELGQLARGLAAAERLLAPAGRLVVVSFHSLEDREVKRFLGRRSGRGSAVSRHLPPPEESPAAPTFRLLFRGVKRPTAAECARNPRARSARMRAAVRTEAPALEAAA